jgi:type IV pilus assembly protein PilW
VSKAVYSANIAGFDARTLKGASEGIDVTVARAVNGSDVLAVRFFGSGPGPNGDGTVVNCAGFSVPAPASQANAEEERGWSIYYVADDATGEPELYCKYRGDGGWTSQAIARGVESFQVLYGVDTDDDGVMNRLCTATEVDALDDTLVLQGVNAIERSRDRLRKTYWKKVVLVKIGLLVRSARIMRSDAPRIQYDLFGKDYAAAHASIDIGTTIEEAKLANEAKNRMRKVFSGTIQLRNPAAGSAT